MAMIYVYMSDSDENVEEIAALDFKNEHEIIIKLETGNTICLGRDEQGDSFVTIDDHEVWDNSYRGEKTR